MQNLHPKKRVTISDIAAAAGVSKTTVSRYLNGQYGAMSGRTRERIQKEIEASQYRPSNLARSLTSKRTLLAGVVVADIASPFSASLIRGIGEGLAVSGYDPIFVDCGNSLEKEISLTRNLLDRGVDGLIINTTDCGNTLLPQLESRGIPIALCDREIKGCSFDFAGMECEQSMRELVLHLHNRGAGTISLFTQPYEAISPRYLRREAFCRTLSELGVANPGSSVRIVDTGDREATKKMLRLLCSHDGTPAVIAQNTITLMHVIGAAQEEHLRIPEDLSVCGIDDWGWSPEIIWPELIGTGITTEMAFPAKVGRQAAALLLRRIAHPDAPKQTVWVPNQLNVRGSTRFRA